MITNTQALEPCTKILGYAQASRLIGAPTKSELCTLCRIPTCNDFLSPLADTYQFDQHIELPIKGLNWSVRSVTLNPLQLVAHVPAKNGTRYCLRKGMASIVTSIKRQMFSIPAAWPTNSNISRSRTHQRQVILIGEAITVMNDLTGGRALVNTVTTPIAFDRLDG